MKAAVVCLLVAAWAALFVSAARRGEVRQTIAGAVLGLLASLLVGTVWRALR